MELVESLNYRGVAVALLSGGFRQIIEPIAESLGIPVSHVHANRLLFHADGSYAGMTPCLRITTGCWYIRSFIHNFEVERKTLHVC